MQSARAFRALRFRILERLFRIDSQKNERSAFPRCPKAIRVMKEYKKIPECSTNDTTVSLVKIRCSFVWYVHRHEVLYRRLENKRRRGMKFSLLRDSTEFPVTVYNNIDGKFDITKIKYDKFNFKLRRRVRVLTWFRCSYSSGYSESGSFRNYHGLWQELKGKRGECCGREGWQLYHRPALDAPLSPRRPSRAPPSSTYGDEWPCKKHDKTGEATYKFLHRANYGIRKEGRIRSVTFHPCYSHLHTDTDTCICVRERVGPSSPPPFPARYPRHGS